VKAEFREVAHEICEVKWIKRFLEDLKFINSSLIKVYYDNKTTILISYNPVLQDRI